MRKKLDFRKQDVMAIILVIGIVPILYFGYKALNNPNSGTMLAYSYSTLTIAIISILVNAYQMVINTTDKKLDKIIELLQQNNQNDKDKF